MERLGGEGSLDLRWGGGGAHTSAEGIVPAVVLSVLLALLPIALPRQVSSDRRPRERRKAVNTGGYQKNISFDFIFFFLSFFFFSFLFFFSVCFLQQQKEKKKRIRET